MKNIFLILFCVLVYDDILAQMPTGYCASAAGFSDDEDITNVELSTISNVSACLSLTGTQGVATGTASLYSNFIGSNVPIPVLAPNTNYSLTGRVTPCDGILFTGSLKAWIDYNRDGTFTEPGETIVLGTTNFTVTTTPVSFTSAFTVPSAPGLFSVGLSRMRISFRETSAAANTPCANGGWGETEDYAVFLGALKHDLTPSKIMTPDSLAFCAEDPQNFQIQVKNVGNQPLPQARVDIYTKGIAPGSPRNFLGFGTTSSTILADDSTIINIGPITFPDDTVMDFIIVSFNPLDTLYGNDTLVKRISVYKRPKFTLMGATVCAGETALVAVQNKTKPAFVRWSNQTLADTAYYKIPVDTATIPRYTDVFVSVNRASPVFTSSTSKCKIDTFVPILINPKPTLTMPRDTVLCAGQTNLLVPNSNATGYTWNDDPGSKTLVLSVPAVSRVYTLIAENSYGCKAIDSVKIGGVIPTPRPKVNDTICLGETATIGIVNTSPDYSYTWKSLPDLTAMITPTPSITSSYVCQWYYRGCTDKDTVSVMVRPLPNINVSSKRGGVICVGFIDTMEVRGTANYRWNSGLGVDSTVIVAPLSTKNYTVQGIDIHGCVSEKSYTVWVKESPQLTVYSNKYNDFVCLGDSATIYVNGALNYQWNDGSRDSIKVFTPNASQQWTVIGTDQYGCKDTNQYRMTVKPAFSVKPPSYRACVGETIRVSLSGGIDYDWGPSVATRDSFHDLVVDASTQYNVLVISKDTCAVNVQIPITVSPKPRVTVADVTVCKGESARLTASGGESYEWPTDPGNTSNSLRVTAASSAQYPVVAISGDGCRDSTIVSLNVMEPDTITFISPVDTYYCAVGLGANKDLGTILVAKPYGGVWTGSTLLDKRDPMVTRLNVHDSSLQNTIQQVTYTVISGNGCKAEGTKNVFLSKKCASSGVINHIVGGVKIYPNPFSREIQVEMNSKRAQEIFLILRDAGGRLVTQRNERIPAGMQTLRLETQDLAKGIYYLEVQTETESQQHKLVRD